MRTAVRAEHGDGLAERIERLALDADQAVEATFEIEAFGHIVIEIGDAAFGVRRGDDGERTAIRQIPDVLERLVGVIGLVQLRLPGAEVRLFRQFSRSAQAIQHAGIVGIAVEEIAIEIPQPAIGIVVEGEAALAIEHGDAG